MRAAIAERFGLDDNDSNTLDEVDTNLFNILGKVSMDLVPGDGLTERQQEIFVSIADNMKDPDDVYAIYPFNNISDNVVNGTLNGYAFVLKPTAPAKVDYFADDFLQCTAISKIHAVKTGLDFKNLAKLGEKLNNCVPIFSSNPCSLKHRNTKTGLDREIWKPELGPNGEAGIYKSSSNWENDYYVMVRASIPVVSQDLIQLIQSEQCTIEEFHKKPEFAWAKEAARRNVLQIMYNISSNLGFRLGDKTCNNAQVDYTSSSTDTTSHAMMSIADHVQYDSTIDEISFNGNDAYGVFKDVVPSSSCEDQLLIYSGCDGGVKRFDTLTKTNAVIGYPATTKREYNITNPEQPNIDQFSKFFVWEGKERSGDTNNGLLHSGTYMSMNEDFKDILGSLGMKTAHPTQELRAVCVKIPTKNQTRHNE